jgi:3-dehydroquinate synthase
MDTTAGSVITVGLGGRSYPIHFGVDILGNLPRLAREAGLGGRAVIVTNETVGPLYCSAVVEVLEQGGIRTASLLLPDGEEHKHLGTIQRIIDFLLEQGADRRTWLVALGGGVIGDMVGFAAAVFLRGVPFVQVPTTLLAQVDSSVGGKTGVNHPSGKNLIGAFHQPRFVLVDVATLMTLPEREYLGGFAEVLKYGIVLDGTFFDYIEEHQRQILDRDRETLLQLTRRCCELKAMVVERDEREEGMRAVLNYGHTLGHAVEALTAYRSYTHGEAVAMGMVAATRVSAHFGCCSTAEAERVRRIIVASGLADRLPPFSRDEYRRAILKDKKMKEGALTLVLNEGIGGFRLQPVTDIDAILDVCGIGG